MGLLKRRSIENRLMDFFLAFVSYMLWFSINNCHNKLFRPLFYGVFFEAVIITWKITLIFYVSTCHMTWDLACIQFLLVCCDSLITYLLVSCLCIRYTYGWLLVLWWGINYTVVVLTARNEWFRFSKGDCLKQQLSRKNKSDILANR